MNSVSDAQQRQNNNSCKERHEYSYASGRTTGITLAKITPDKKYVYTSQDDTLRLNDKPINEPLILEELHQYQSYGNSIK